MLASLLLEQLAETLNSRMRIHIQATHSKSQVKEDKPRSPPSLTTVSTSSLSTHSASSEPTDEPLQHILIHSEADRMSSPRIPIKYQQAYDDRLREIRIPLLDEDNQHQTAFLSASLASFYYSSSASSSSSSHFSSEESEVATAQITSEVNKDDEKKSKMMKDSPA